MRLVLEMVHQATHADVAFLCCPAADDRPVELVGTPALPAEWCRAVLRTLLRQTPGVKGQLLCSSCVGRLPEPAPASVALVRLSKSQSLWVAAVTFDAGRPFRRSDVNLMRLTRRMLAQQSRYAQTCGQLRDTLFGLVRCLTASLDARDPYTWGHSERVARMGVRLARQLGRTEAEVNDLYLAGLLHDIGKIGVRDDVLSKPGALTPEERALVEKHTVIGDAIVSHVAYLEHLRPGVRSHHEHYDGNGYPDRLAGEAIPRMARILAVADALDAMLSERPTARAWRRRASRRFCVTAVASSGIRRRSRPFSLAVRSCTPSTSAAWASRWCARSSRPSTAPSRVWPSRPRCGTAPDAEAPPPEKSEKSLRWSADPEKKSYPSHGPNRVASARPPPSDARPTWNEEFSRAIIPPPER